MPLNTKVNCYSSNIYCGECKLQRVQCTPYCFSGIKSFLFSLISRLGICKTWNYQKIEDRVFSNILNIWYPNILFYHVECGLYYRIFSLLKLKIKKKSKWSPLSISSLIMVFWRSWMTCWSIIFEKVRIGSRTQIEFKIGRSYPQLTTARSTTCYDAVKGIWWTLFSA